MFTTARRILAAGSACLIALIGLVVLEGRARAAGTEVILPMQPVDPRALLTGHYVQMTFANPLPEGETCPATASRAEDRQAETWLALQRSGDIHVFAGAYDTRAEAARHGDVVAKGSAQCMSMPTATRDGEAMRETYMVTLDLGIDRFHADQDEAETLEKILRNRERVDRLMGIVSIGPDGTARTKGLVIDGKRVELTWF